MMWAIEIQSKTDSKGHLKLDCQLDKFNMPVKELILMDEENSDEEKLGLSDIIKSISFDFLNNTEEDIYSLTDREKFNDGNK